MKNIFLHAVFLTAIIFASCGYSLASSGGTGARGGGSVIQLDQKYTLAEIFSLEGGTNGSLSLSPDLRSLMGSIRKLLTGYTGLQMEKFWDEVDGPYADYRLTHKLPCDGIDHPLNILGAKSEYVGCTEDGITYLDPVLFDKLGTKEKVLTLLHERAHIFDRSNYAHETWIYPLIRGIYVLLTIRLEQEKGNWRTLQPYELRALRELLENPYIASRLRARIREPSVPGVRTITPQGGGFLYFDDETDQEMFHTDKNSFVGVGASADYSRARCRITKKSNYAPTITNSTIYSSAVRCANLDRSTLRFSRVDLLSWDGRLGEIRNSTISGSSLEIAGQTVDLRQSIFLNSFFVHDWVNVHFIANHAHIEKSFLDYTGVLDQKTESLFPIGPIGEISTGPDRQTILSNRSPSNGHFVKALSNKRKLESFNGSELSSTQGRIHVTRMPWPSGA